MYVVYQLMYENVYGKTPPPRFGEYAVTLPLDVDRPRFYMILQTDKRHIFCDLVYIC